MGVEARANATTVCNALCGGQDGGALAATFTQDCVYDVCHGGRDAAISDCLMAWQTLLRSADVALRLMCLVVDSAIFTKLVHKRRFSLAYAMRAPSMATRFATLYSEYALWLTRLEDEPDNDMALCSCMRG